MDSVRANTNKGLQLRCDGCVGDVGLCTRSESNDAALTVLQQKRAGARLLSRPAGGGPVIRKLLSQQGLDRPSRLPDQRSDATAHTVSLPVIGGPRLGRVAGSSEVDEYASMPQRENPCFISGRSRQCSHQVTRPLAGRRRHRLPSPSLFGQPHKALGLARLRICGNR